METSSRLEFCLRSWVSLLSSVLYGCVRHVCVCVVVKSYRLKYSPPAETRLSRQPQCSSLANVSIRARKGSAAKTSGCKSFIREPTVSDGCVRAQGANSHGQLGQGHAEDQLLPRLSDTAALQDRAVLSVCGGGGHSVFVTENGEVFVCGQNHRGQLGLGHHANITTLQLCPSLNQTVTNVACGWDFTLLLTDCGQVLACGSNAFGQLGVGPKITHSADLLIVKCLKEPVVIIAAGLRHSLAVTSSADVYQWGAGLFSHAKRALSPHPVPTHLCSQLPCLVPGLDQKKSHLVAAGSAHCVCLTEDGDLFLWGSNKHGQLTTSEPFLSSPTPLKRSLVDGEKVMSVWSGWTHIVAQTESGRVFTWGRGDYGQLGRQASTTQNAEQQSAGPSTGSENMDVCLPTEVKVLRGATQIACGSEHNLAIVGGCLLSWGWNEHGMCGDGSQTDVSKPQLISGLQPLLIGCGAGHSMAVCTAMTAPTPSGTVIQHVTITDKKNRGTL